MNEILDVYDEKLLQRILFDNYKQYAIIGTDEVLLLNIDSQNKQSIEKNILFNKKTKDFNFSEYHQGCGNLQFSNELNRLFLQNKTNIFYFKNEEFLEIYKLIENNKLKPILKMKTNMSNINYIKNGFLNKIISNKNFNFCKIHLGYSESSTLIIETKTEGNEYRNYENFSSADHYEKSDNVYSLNDNSQIFLQEEVFVAKQSGFLNNTTKIKIFTKNNFFEIDLSIKKAYKISEISHMEINKNLLSVFILVKRNEYKKFLINLNNGKTYEQQQKIQRIIEIEKHDKVIEMYVFKNYLEFKHENALFFKTNKNNFSSLNTSEKNLKIFLNNKNFIYDFDLKIKKYISKTEDIYKRTIQKDTLLVCFQNQIFIKNKNYKDSVIKNMNDIDFFSTHYKIKNLIFLKNDDNSFFVFDIKKSKIVFNKYYLIKNQNIDSQIFDFYKQTNFERLKTNILNKTIFEKEQKK